MCGICGFNWQDETLVRSMAQTMTHRGPDQEGVFCSPRVSLAHRRLSIIDLSENGRQPMFNEDGSVVLVFNGEIYNFQELREQLLHKGHQFSSRSDSEVIIHAYEEWGVESISRLRGMFAYALYDKNKDSLLIVRDRIGIKPLYYCHLGDRFVFASEIKAILEDPGVERRVNFQALYDYLGFEFVPAPQTMFDGINKLPAGHYLLLENNRITIEKYWDLSFQQEAPASFAEAVEKMREQLDFAVKSHLI
ncbi:MAG: asparagine synthase (glutamine-hydrolyzing), partial [Desulfocapsaceae bacterium]|nr:asparagine synthase (glutamine-hydrolyzing) [Desulfocapsaceae bacterium]